VEEITGSQEGTDERIWVPAERDEGDERNVRGCEAVMLCHQTLDILEGPVLLFVVAYDRGSVLVPSFGHCYVARKA
jgi:hypothetical protein